MNTTHIASMTIENKDYNITATSNSVDTIQQLGKSDYLLVGAVLSLGPDRINALQSEHDEAVIIDKANQISIVADFSTDDIIVVAVIQNENVFTKDNTTIKTI